MNNAGPPGTAHVVGQAQAKVLVTDLAITRTPPELVPHFLQLCQTGCPNRMTLGLQSTGGVDRPPALPGGLTISGGESPLAWFKEPKIRRIYQKK